MVTELCHSYLCRIEESFESAQKVSTLENFLIHSTIISIKKMLREENVFTFPQLRKSLGPKRPILFNSTESRSQQAKLSQIQAQFRDTTNPMCATNDGIEDTEHFLLLCPCFDVHRRDLLAGIFALLRPLEYVDLANECLLQLLLYGNKDFPDSVNRHILELTLNFIHNNGRFDQSLMPHPSISHPIVTLVL